MSKEEILLSKSGYAEDEDVTYEDLGSNCFLMKDIEDAMDEYAEEYAEGFIIERNYWRERCEAAEKFIEESPGDPDIYPDQIEAHKIWKELVNKKR